MAVVGHASSSYSVRISREEMLRLRSDGTAEVQRYELFTKERERTFAYIPLFGWRTPDELPSPDALCALGIAMMAEPRPFRAGTIPAGYTYLGQFIFHDITFMLADDVRHSYRTPALDLDSVLANNAVPTEPCEDGNALAVGTTSNRVKFAEDLPRMPSGNCVGRPLIRDRRNDDFLPLAQCHLTLLKFYNTIARRLGSDRIAEVRPLWLKHFQHVVLHDYLPRIVGVDAYRSVMDNGRKIVGTMPLDKTTEWLPIEFAVGFGRFGHSMIRDEYMPWNDRVFNQPTGVPTFMDFSWHNGRIGHDTDLEGALPFDWLPNWFHLFDFTEGRYAGAAPPPICAGRIDTALTPSLKELPQKMRDRPLSGCGATADTFNLAVATLLRGWTAGVAPAKEAVRIVNQTLPIGYPRIPELTQDKLVSYESKAVQQAFEDFPELGTKTPLWYYILKEADVLSDGNALGPLGARLLMETLHAAIEASSTSILRDPEWRPIWPRARRDNFTMADLIAFTGDPNPLARWTQQGG